MPMRNILDFGALPGQMCTAAIQAALDAAGEAGETVVIPRGSFLSGTLNLGSASLCLEKGARLVASRSMDDYVPNGYEHNEMGKALCLLSAMDQQDVRIYGQGVIDLSGDAFYDMDKRAVPPGRKFTPVQVAECTATYKARPTQPLFFYRCRHITVEGVRIENAPCWTMTFVECADVRVRDVTIDNDLRIPNSDGMHFCCCKGVIVKGCNISSGDDCIAITCITDWNKPCQDIVISDCILRSCSKAIVAGYMHGIVRNVVITNCIIKESNRALALMASSHTGLVENVVASNLYLDTRVRAGNWWGNGEPVCIMATYHHNPRYRDQVPDHDFPVNIHGVLLQNLVCTAENVLAVVGEGGNVADIRLDHISFTLKDSDNLALKGRMVDISPSPQAAFLPDDGKAYWLHLQGVRDVTVTNAHVARFHGEEPGVSMVNCQDIAIS